MSAMAASALGEAALLIARTHGGSGALEEEHPLTLARDPQNCLVALEEAGAVRSACAVLPRRFRVDGHSIAIGLIGSVSTEPAFRGRGLATRLLLEAEARLRSAGCAFALLWAEDPSYYEARGYRPIGAELDFLLPQACAPRLPSAQGVRALAPGDVEAVHRLSLAQPARVERTLEEFRALLRCPRMQARVLERDGRVLAFACCGKGRDFRGVVHEWAGEPEHLLPLLRAELEQLPADMPGLFVIAPPQAVGLRRALAELGLEPAVGILGLAKVIDRERAAQLLGELVAPRGRVEIEALAAPADAREPQLRVVLRGQSGAGELSDDSLLTLLFSARGERADIEQLGRAFGFDAARLPLLPFAFGLDSI